jgi:hypothetical protein
MNSVNFHAGRIFYQSSTHGTVTGWYFLARNGRTIGPFQSGDELQVVLRSFLRACMVVGDTGGRCSRCESVA